SEHVAGVRQRHPDGGVGGHQHEVDGVEHQLDCHQHQHRVAAYQDAVHAEPEQQGRDDVGDDRMHHEPSSPAVRAPMSGRETTIAPTSAASSSTESTSNGSTQVRNTAVPSASAPAGAGSTVDQ